MKINPIANMNLLQSYVAAKVPPEKSKVAGGRDEVTFSEEALNFSKALAEARESIELRTAEEKERIADITSAVRQGSYEVSSDKVADKILQSVQRSK